MTTPDTAVDPPAAERPGMLPRLAYLIALGAVVAGLTHVATILALPYHSDRDAFARVSAVARGAALTTVAVPSTLLPYGDPALATAGCLYDLRAGAVHVDLDVTGTDFAVLAVYGRHGQTLYGLTSRSATRDRLALTILTPAQAEADPSGGDDTTPPEIRVVTSEPRGLVLAEVLAVSPNALRQAQAKAGSLACRGSGAAMAPK